MRVSTVAGSPLSFGSLLALATRRLERAGLVQPRLEATVLACHCFGRERADLLAHPERPVEAKAAEQYRGLVERRARFEPTAYLVGEREFYGRGFVVDRRVLIPRPESELLIESALEVLRPGGPTPLAVDVGTGSGCLGATLALERPAARVVVSDISPEALAVARQNLARHGLSGRVGLVEGDLLTWLGGPVDLIVANLPYVPREALAELPPDVVRYEPRLALDGGPTGTRLLLALLLQARERGFGHLLAELDPRHAAHVEAAARATCAGRPVDVLADLAGRPRLLRIGPP